MGIQFARKAVRLFSPFYASDIIIGDPLGLRMIVGYVLYPIWVLGFVRVYHLGQRETRPTQMEKD